MFAISFSSCFETTILNLTQIFNTQIVGVNHMTARTGCGELRKTKGAAKESSGRNKGKDCRSRTRNNDT